jgi:chemotaxis protein methyltransferase CheR
VSLLATIENKLSHALGLRARHGAAWHLERLLSKLHKEHGLDACEVARRVGDEPWLVRCLGGALTVDETFFFRHPEHFALLTRHVCESLKTRPAAKTVLWSAGCASGEEPYSMAIAIHAALGAEALSSVRILANDVSEPTLERARRATYGRWSFRGAEPALARRYFEPTQCGELRLRAELARSVELRHLSLDEQLSELRSASVDVIFFRNVAIYMTQEALNRLYEGASRVLREGGLLVLGPADPAPCLPTLARCPATTAFARCGAPSSLPRAKRAPAPCDARVAVARSMPHVTLRERPAPSTPEPAQHVTAVETQLVCARRLADLGQSREALAMLTADLERRGKSAQHLSLRGRIHFALGQFAESAEDLRAALFLEPARVVTRFHYALGLSALGRRSACRAQLLDILRTLDALSETQTLDDEELTVGSLRRAVSELMGTIE